MSTQLYAVIREDSRYFYQNPPRRALPFPVTILDTTDSYRVSGNGEQYRLDDLCLFVKAGNRYRPLNGEAV
ncbi:hypothetical protein ACL7TT_17060 [Microbulbifer sp. 2304DJ12-6]|uniref:Uncharacterized protein n=1 Tax=Microbulbifer spongiae TaxID=2944933 RepID=A0ABY9E8T6_9GAMM|nr:hypothetical protein [Microbulbifer sp. MI-G]WKD48361.1 hypothetical protein M8T91_10480 [Microbulbifer sp. MI-G]